MSEGNIVEDIELLINYTKQLKILYVEDSPDGRDATMIILEEFFDTITVAVDGEDGLEKFKENEIDLIITDINMPKMNGIDMSKKIRELDDDVSILILSAFNESEYFMDSIKIGVEGYIIKPINIDQFISVLNKVVKTLKLKDEAERNLNFLHQYQEVTDKKRQYNLCK